MASDNDCAVLATECRELLALLNDKFKQGLTMGLTICLFDKSEDNDDSGIIPNPKQLVIDVSKSY